MALGESLYDFSVYLGFNISEGSDQLVSSPSMIEALCRTVQPKFMRTTRQNSTRSRCSSPPKLPALVKLQQVGTDVSACAVEKVQSLNDQHIRKHTTEQTSTTTGIGGGVTIIKPRMFGLPGHTGMALDKDTMQEDVDSLLGDSRSQRSVQISQLCPIHNRLSSYVTERSPMIKSYASTPHMQIPSNLLGGSMSPVLISGLQIQKLQRAKSDRSKGILKSRNQNSAQQSKLSESPSKKKVIFSRKIQILYFTPDHY